MASIKSVKNQSITVRKGVKVALVVSQYNSAITHTLQKSCIAELMRQGVKPTNIIIRSVPGAFELPYACRKVMLTKKVHAVIAIAVIIQGETPHFGYLASQCARGIMELNLHGSTPVIFGVLTTHTTLQAKDRIAGGKCGDKGIEFARSALQML